MVKKVLLLVFVLVLIVGLQPADAAKKVKVGIIHLLEHPDHNALREGFLDGLKAKGYDVDIVEIFNVDSVNYPNEINARAVEGAKRIDSNGAEIIYSTGVYLAIKDLNLKIFKP